MKYRQLKRKQATRFFRKINQGYTLCGLLFFSVSLSATQVFALPDINYAKNLSVIHSINAEYDRNLTQGNKVKAVKKTTRKHKHKKGRYTKNIFNPKELRFLKKWLGKGQFIRRNRIFINNCISRSRNVINRRLQSCASGAIRVAAIQRPIRYYYDVYGLGLGLGQDLGLDPYKNRAKSRKHTDFPPPGVILGKSKTKKSQNRNSVIHLKKKWVR